MSLGARLRQFSRLSRPSLGQLLLQSVSGAIIEAIHLTTATLPLGVGVSKAPRMACRTAKDLLLSDFRIQECVSHPNTGKSRSCYALQPEAKSVENPGPDDRAYQSSLIKQEAM